MKLVGFVPASAGTYQRGASERARQWRMIQTAGGVVEYMQGPRPRVEKPVDVQVLDVVKFKQPRGRRRLHN